MKNIYFLLIAIVFTAASCFTKKGDPGPAGTQGSTGTTGATGASTLDKQGFVTGTLVYVDYKDSALSLPFTYEYTQSLSQSEYDTYTDENGLPRYEIYFTRRDIKDAEKTVDIYLDGSINTDGSYETPNKTDYTYGGINFSYVCLINNNLFEFDSGLSQGQYTYFRPDGGTDADITNFALDTVSGRLTFEYKITYSPNDINNNDVYDYNTPATLTGSVDVVVTRKKYPATPKFVTVQLPPNQNQE